MEVQKPTPHCLTEPTERSNLLDGYLSVGAASSHGGLELSQRWGATMISSHQVLVLGDRKGTIWRKNVHLGLGELVSMYASCLCSCG